MNTTDKIKVAVFDDNKSRRESLKMLLALYPDIECVGSFVDCANVIEDIRMSQPHVVLMDIEMPNVDGIEGVALIRKNFPLTSVIMQTVFEDDDKVFESLRNGACGYILKKTPPEKIIEAIRDAHLGGAPITPAIAQRVLSFFVQKPSIRENTYSLTNREKEILTLLVDGKSYKMIAAESGTSYHTVNAHIRNIYDKLHVHSLGEAVSKAIRERIV